MTDSLEAQKSSLDRAVRYLQRSRQEVLGSLEALKANASQEARDDLGASIQLLRDQVLNVDVLLVEFERTAVVEKNDTFQTQQDGWGDALYEGQQTMARAQKAHEKPLPGSQPPAGPPSSGDSDSGQPSTSAGGQTDSTQLTAQVARLLTLMEARESAHPTPSSADPSPVSGASGALQCKLPKLEIPKFEGDVLKWHSFWDRFEAAVDKNDRIAPVDKLNYLVGMLDKEPLSLVRTLTLTNENYEVAKKVLDKKYGNKRMVISLMYRRLNEMKPVGHDPNSLRRFVAEIDCLMGSLGSLGQDTKDDNFATLILSKLSPTVVIMLEMTKDVSVDWTVDLVREKLSDYLVRLDSTSKVAASAKGQGQANPFDHTNDFLFAGEGSKTGKKWQGKGDKKGKEPRGGAKGASAKPGPQEKKPWCAFCEGQHYPDLCTKFKTADERFRQIGDRCRLCLRAGHKKADCRSEKPCFYCGMVGSHHASLCFTKFGRPRGNPSNFANTDQNPRGGPSGGNSGGSGSSQGNGSKANGGDTGDSSMLASGEGVALQTAKIPVQCDPDDSGTFVVTRSLFDIGANRTYCTQHLARKLGIKTRRQPPLKINRFGPDGPVSIPTRSGILRLRKLDGSIATIEVSVIPQITGRLVRTPVRSKNLEKLISRVRLADDVPSDFEKTGIDLLIGNDYYLDFVMCDKIEVDKGLYLLGSVFGYILSGRTSLPSYGGYSIMAMCGITCGALEGLDNLVGIPKTDDRMMKKPEMSDLWSLEQIGIKEDPAVTSDDLAMQNFAENVKFENGRYSVSLPLNENAPELESNYMLSVGRLKSQVKKLNNDPGLFETYNAIIEDQLVKGVIEPVDESTPVGRTHYIQHHAVVTPQKETTKVRVVYDGSAKFRKESPSLNECLHRGPVLLEDLVGLLIKFRTHKYAVVSDIEKAFLQIGINHEDRDLLRFLWLRDPAKRRVEGNLQAFRFCRVLFGLNCSPSLLLQTVRHHLKQVGSPVASQIDQNLYADNVITGVDSLEEGKRFYAEAKAIFSQASMNLRQWSSNSSELMDFIPEQDQIKSRCPKVLGLEWNRDTDQMVVTAGGKLDVPAQTKRQFLSQISTIFDPLGYFAPVTVSGKIMLQAACESKPGWDTKLADSVVAQWDEHRKRLLEIATQPIPRHIPCHGKRSLLAFADASTSSFAATVYLRNEACDVHVNLLFAKTRLNPVKKLTVPRLELLGILIAVRALNFVSSQLKMSKTDGLVFSDSKCALAWLCSEKKQDVFVKNRVKEIAKSKWLKYRYVNTTENPADLATRGKRASELDSFWWNGPKWTRNPKLEWPTWDSEEVVAVDAASPPGPLHEVSMLVVPEPLLEVEDFSSHYRLIRITAFCLRFVDRARKTGEMGDCLTAQELARAQKKWEVQVQSEAYGPVKEKLTHKSEQPMGNLMVFQDSEGILRCRGRMAKADLAWETKFPKLLPKSHPYSRLIVERAHCRGGHPSVNHTHILLRQEYWIPKGRQLVKSVVHECTNCRKAAGRAFARPPMPELPVDRVVPQPCFTTTGVDYFGPLKLRGPTQTEKAWVALFTCLTTRAVHLELVLDLSAEQFLMALRRFIARRGKPTKMISDNGTQFKAVAKTLEVTWDKTVQDPAVLDFAAREGITWSFIVEYAPYMGGVYERLVGIVKTCLRKTVGSALLTAKQFETVLCECEAIVNTRPLSYVSSDLSDGFVLTPAHFLSINPRIAVPNLPPQLKQDSDLYLLDSPTLNTLVESWTKRQNLLSEVWRTWKEEYLNLLRERASYRHKKNQGSPATPRTGEVVLLKEMGVPRGSWKLARISKVNKSADGSIRSCTLELPSGRKLHRPVNLLVPMEVVSDDPASEPDEGSQPQNNGDTTGSPTATGSVPEKYEVVLAKLRGYPIWPAKVLTDWSHTPLKEKRAPKESVAVQFFQTDRFAFVPKSGIGKFDPTLQVEVKRKDLLEAFKLAKKFMS